MKVLIVEDECGNIMSAFSSLCDGYLIKPVSKAQVLGKLREIGLVA